MHKTPLKCKQAHTFYVSKIFKRPTSEARLLEAGFKDEAAAKYSLAFKVTKILKLSMFLFKVNHYILYTRDKLFRAKIIDWDK